MDKKEEILNTLSNKIKRQRKFELMKLITIITLIIMAIGIFVIFPHITRNEYQVTITDKQVKRSGKQDKYLIYAQTLDGKTVVFEDTDNIFEFKFNSSDIYGELIKNKKYDIKTYGWRIPVISSYENIINVDEVK